MYFKLCGFLLGVGAQTQGLAPGRQELCHWFSPALWLLGVGGILTRIQFGSVPVSCPLDYSDRHPEPWDSSSTVVETHTWKCHQGPLPCWEAVELMVRNQVPHLGVEYTISSVVAGSLWEVRQLNQGFSSRVPFYAFVPNALFPRKYY